jgi:hypothetical protein
MKTKKYMVLFAAILGIAILPSCCLETINMKPQMSTVDLKKATAGTANFDVVFTFKECCPSKKQKALALRLQERVGDLFDELLEAKITLDDYNSKIAAAEVAVTKVILVCKSVEGPKPVVLTSAFSAGPMLAVTSIGSGERRFTDQDLESAWSNLEKVTNQL